MTNAPLVKRFAANGKGRDFVAGDLHGCRAELDALRKRVGFKSSQDRLFCVGDLCDRGPDSIGCLKLLYEPWFHCVLGNHEVLMLDAYRGRTDGYLWRVNGGTWAAGLSLDEQTLLRDIADKIEALPLAIVVGEGAERFNVVHAEFTGADAEMDAGAFDPRRQLMMVWGRTIAHEDSPFTGDDLSPTYCGHTIMRSVTRRASHVFIDTGAFIAHGHYVDAAEGRLTMIEPRSGEVWQATALDTRDASKKTPRDK